MSAHGKQYRNARAAFDREQEYSPVEAIRLLKEMQTAKFDETVEVHFRLGLNVRHADEQLRGTLMLPHGTGKEANVAVFAEGEKAKEAQDAGADIVGSADLAKRVEEGFTEFDVAIATPDQMGHVGKLGRILGPRGLMPNPKTGTRPQPRAVTSGRSRSRVRWAQESTSIPRRRAASSTSWRSRQKQFPHKRPSPETGSGRKAEVFPRRIGE